MATVAELEAVAEEVGPCIGVVGTHAVVEGRYLRPVARSRSRGSVGPAELDGMPKPRCRTLGESIPSPPW